MHTTAKTAKTETYNMHPLAPDLSGLDDAELQTKYSELSKRVMIAQRMGMGDAMMQLMMLMEDYTAEMQRRQEKMMEKLMQQTGKEFKDIIDIS